MNKNTLTTLLVSGSLALIVVLAFVVSLLISGDIIIQTTVSGIPTPEPYPTPIPTPTQEPPLPDPMEHWRGITALTEVLDTDTGLESGTTNPSPFAGTEVYTWVGEDIFHTTDRIPDSTRTLILPPCIGVTGERFQRYLYAEPNTFAVLQAVRVDGETVPVTDWPKVGEFEDGDVTFDVYASRTRLNCYEIGGKTLEVYP